MNENTGSNFYLYFKKHEFKGEEMLKLCVWVSAFKFTWKNALQFFLMIGWLGFNGTMPL